MQDQSGGKHIEPAPFIIGRVEHDVTIATLVGEKSRAGESSRRRDHIMSAFGEPDDFQAALREEGVLSLLVTGSKCGRQIARAR